ncbi:MAG: DUF4450 domain-containing protein [Paludibacter sp.]|nr:DUF4450 domain-containing protein [Paludibacter sp.]
MIRYNTITVFVFGLILSFSGFATAFAQNGNKVYDPELNQLVDKNQSGNQRKLRYKPDGQDFVIINGKNKFNRALYGTHTSFRVETGDVPEFALYLPRMGGNLSFSFAKGKKTVDLNNAAYVESRYRAGSRIYKITDPMLGKGELKITVLAMTEAEGMILRLETKNIPSGLRLHWKFGGCADKRFSREGDLGVDPVDCFDLKPQYCKGNEFTVSKNSFEVIFGAKKDKKLDGVFPEKSKLQIASPVTFLNGQLSLSGNRTYYFMIKVSDNQKLAYKNLNSVFEQAEVVRQKVASQISIETPDSFFNTLGETLAVAADGIWSGETWLHGAVGWRMPLSGWRAAYTGDFLGWHDRAKVHFDAYAASQVTDVPPVRPHPTQDTALHLARAEKSWGTQMYSNGYICRNPNRNDQMHHYDMNLCYMDELMWHFKWTGDTAYARRMWPVIIRHLAWEKRNYDPDNDGLYDAYCCIWASDALYYNSGAVTHSSAYNYRANRIAAQIAEKIGENPEPYRKEAEKILKAMNETLWLPEKGHWAEFRDFMGKRRLHDDAAVWTIYHAIDSEVDDPFQAYQSTRYIDTSIPHIPVVAEGLKNEGYATISTSDWMPYSWSINNVAFAEVMHTALAYWEAGRREEAFLLLKSSVLDGMYLGASPGNIGQISFYDAARRECYRDFGDPIGVMSRALVQGLFGIYPDALNGKLVIRPGFPASWEHAAIKTPDVQFSFRRENNTEKYVVSQHINNVWEVSMQLEAGFGKIMKLTANGNPVQWKYVESAIDVPQILIQLPNADSTLVEIDYQAENMNFEMPETPVVNGAEFTFTSEFEMPEVYDPQKILSEQSLSGFKLKAKVNGLSGHHTFFVRMKNADASWWKPFNIYIKGTSVNYGTEIHVPDNAVPDMIDLSAFYNDSVTNIFKNRYFSPRSPYTTLQIPTQGIGEWCHPLTAFEVDDSGVRKIVAGNGDVLKTNLKINFRTPAEGQNIMFTSLWSNFPQKKDVPLIGKAKSAVMWLAGSTNHMQSHFQNGLIVITYVDDSKDTLELRNPDNWCPIEQDYYADGQAFVLKTPRPYRIQLSTGLVSDNLEKDLKIEGVYGRRISGGAGVILQMPLNKNKELRKLTLETTANEIVIGLMSLTLLR